MTLLEEMNELTTLAKNFDNLFCLMGVDFAHVKELREALGKRQGKLPVLDAHVSFNKPMSYVEAMYMVLCLIQVFKIPRDYILESIPPAENSWWGKKAEYKPF